VKAGHVVYEGSQANTIGFREIAYLDCGKGRGSNEVEKEEVLVRNVVQGKDVDMPESWEKGLSLEYCCDGHINVGRYVFHERLQL
jgi:hypothetical protein